MSKLFTATAFAAKARHIAENCKTCYMLGPWGWPTTQAMINRACADPTNGKKNTGWKSYATAIQNKGFIFDCVGLIKGILWGWSEDLSKSYGGAGYACNGVPDYGADTMIKKCTNVSTDFSTIKAGEAVWMSGHIGIYIGGGVVVEATPKWKNGVQKSTCGNVQTSLISGTVGSRKWTKHGQLPWVDYGAETVQKPDTVNTSATGTTTTTTAKAEAAMGKDASLAGTYSVTASALNIRAGAGTSKAILGTLKKGTKVRCYGYYTAVGSTKWLYVVANGITGFVSSQYLSKA